MGIQLAVQINPIADLSLTEIESVDGGWATFGRALAGSFVGRAIYDAVVYVAENGGPPPPNLGFH
jgi:hypothetical protein